MLTINIICTGKIKENYLKEAIAEYSKRLSKYCNLEIIELPDEKIPEKTNYNIEETIKQKECKNAIAHIKKDSYVICLDLKGKEFSSKEKICFSKMTFPHQLIRVFLLEQIFRAFKISKGETYHR